MKNYYQRMASLSLISLLSACASGPLVLPNEGPETYDVYKDHLAGEVRQRSETQKKVDHCNTRFFVVDDEKSAGEYKQFVEAKSSVPDNNFNCFKVDRPPSNLDSYPSSVQLNSRNEMLRKFEVLPNPRFVLYVHSHFTASGNPVPLYNSEWFLYDKVQYAKRGELINTRTIKSRLSYAQ